MSPYEALSIVVSCIAVVLSLVVWNGQRRMQREANDLQRATSELAKKQLEILLREEQGKNSARLSVSLKRDGKGFKFWITNISDVDAKDVDFALVVARPEDNPLVKSEYEQKFPAKRLQPGESVSLLAALFLSSPTGFNTTLKWTNPDGTRIEDETYVAL
jgi:hypothetical protein